MSRCDGLVLQESDGRRGLAHFGVGQRHPTRLGDQLNVHVVSVSDHVRLDLLGHALVLSALLANDPREV